MNKIIGFGKWGCLVAEELTAYPEYRIYKIDSDINERASLSIGVFDDIEEYEKNVDTQEVSLYLRSVKPGDQVLFICSGEEKIIGAALPILEVIRDAEINVLYLCPDREVLSQEQKRDDKIAFNILQEYARSGLFQNIYLVDLPMIDKMIGDVPITEYKQKIANFISYVVAMVNYYDNTDSYMANLISPKDFCRIGTFRISSINPSSEGAVNMFFPMDKKTDLHFYYGVPKQDLEEDAQLTSRIKNHVRQHSTDKMAASFSIYEIDQDDVLVLCKCLSSTVQKFSGNQTSETE